MTTRTTRFGQPSQRLKRDRGVGDVLDDHPRGNQIEPFVGPEVLQQALRAVVQEWILLDVVAGIQADQTPATPRQ